MICKVCQDIHVECSLLLVFDDGGDHHNNNGSALIHGKEPDWKWDEPLMLRRHWFNPNDIRGGCKAALSHRLLCFGKTIRIV